MAPEPTRVENLAAAISELPPDAILSRTIHEDEDLKAIVFGFAPGQELSEHTASKPAVLQILEGRARVTLGGEAAEAEPGFWAYLPPGLPHSIAARSRVTMLLLMLAGSGRAGAP